MAVLARVDTARVTPASGISDGGMPLRDDRGEQLPLERTREAFAPEMRDGFFLVPRLATHDTAAEALE
jgi:aspartyl-tRNA(Asn)/glutamyl-tRNA(Gln) amidotransferase subunit C